MHKSFFDTPENLSLKFKMLQQERNAIKNKQMGQNHVNYTDDSSELFHRPWAGVFNQAHSKSGTEMKLCLQDQEDNDKSRLALRPAKPTFSIRQSKKNISSNY